MHAADGGAGNVVCLEFRVGPATVKILQDWRHYKIDDSNMTDKCSPAAVIIIGV